MGFSAPLPPVSAAPKCMLDEVISLCGEILKGTTDEIPYPWQGKPVFIAKAVDQQMLRKDGVYEISFSAKTRSTEPTSQNSVAVQPGLCIPCTGHMKIVLAQKKTCAIPCSRSFLCLFVSFLRHSSICAAHDKRGILCAKLKCNTRSHIRRAVHFDLCIVQDRSVLDNGQSKSGAAGRPGVTLVHPVKRSNTLCCSSFGIPIPVSSTRIIGCRSLVDPTEISPYRPVCCT